MCLSMWSWITIMMSKMAKKGDKFCFKALDKGHEWSNHAFSQRLLLTTYMYYGWAMILFQLRISFCLLISICPPPPLGIATIDVHNVHMYKAEISPYK